MSDGRYFTNAAKPLGNFTLTDSRQEMPGMRSERDGDGERKLRDRNSLTGVELCHVLEMLLSLARATVETHNEAS